MFAITAKAFLLSVKRRKFFVIKIGTISLWTTQIRNTPVGFGPDGCSRRSDVRLSKVFLSRWPMINSLR